MFDDWKNTSKMLIGLFYRKSPEEECIVRTREESDSSVVDPETEGI